MVLEATLIGRRVSLALEMVALDFTLPERELYPSA